MTTIMHLGRRSLKWLPFLLFPFFLLSSCSESDDTVEEYPNWQATNTAYWTNIMTQAQNAIAQGDTSWRIYKNYSLEDSLSSTPSTDNIVVNVLESGTGSGCPLYTDSVRVRYEGRLLPSTSYSDGYVFNTTWPTGTTDATAGATDFLVSGLTDGFATGCPAHAHRRQVARVCALDAGLRRVWQWHHTRLFGVALHHPGSWPTVMRAAVCRRSRPSQPCG